MPDGPVVALAILVAGLAILAIGFLIARIRNPERGRHHIARTAPRLPLFGTDLLMLRTVDDELVAVEASGAESDDADAASPARPSPERAAAAAGSAASGSAASFAPPPAHSGATPRANGSAPAGDAASPIVVTGDALGARQRTAPPRSAPPPRDLRPASRPAGDRPGAPRTPIEFRTTAPSDGSPRPGDIAALGANATAAPRVERAPAPAAAGAPAPRGEGHGISTITAPEPEEYVEGQTLRFAVPTDGTLQFLPGRLEVISGADAGREIRFVRLPGEPAVEVTFGRTAGPSYSHVQLHARTVSRRHAVMSLLDDHWQLQNLSTTNPVVLNSRTLAPDEIAPLLVEGDRIEMGEVVFVFHTR